MRKTHWLRNTILILAVCAAVGLILSGVIFYRDQGRTYATANMTFAFDGAAEGLAPNGYMFNPGEIASEAVIAEALEAAGLTGTYDPAVIKANLSVEGIYPEDLVEQMTSYDSVTGSGSSRSLRLSSYFPTTYTIRLYNDFDKSLAEAKLRDMLTGLMETYRTYLARTSAMGEMKPTLLENLADYDYFQQTEFLEVQLTEARNYANDMAKKEPTLRVNGKSFSEAALQFSTLISTDLDTVNGLITVNALSKDLARQQAQLTYNIQTLQDQVAVETERLNRLGEMVSTYAKNGIIYLSNGESFTKVDSFSSVEYDTLATQQNQVAANIASMKSEILNYQIRLEALQAAINATTEEAASRTDSSLEMASAGDAGTAAAMDTNPLEAQEDETAESGADGNEAETDETGTAGEKAKETTDLTAVTEVTAEEVNQKSRSLQRRLNSLVTRTRSAITGLNALLDAYNEQEVNADTVVIGKVQYKRPTLISGAAIKQAIKTAGPICAVGFMIAMVLIIVSRWKEMKKYRK